MTSVMDLVNNQEITNLENWNILDFFKFACSNHLSKTCFFPICGIFLKSQQAEPFSQVLDLRSNHLRHHLHSDNSGRLDYM